MLELGVVSHAARSEDRDRKLATALQCSATTHEPELLDPDAVQAAISTRTDSSTQSPSPGINGSEKSGQVIRPCTGERSAITEVRNHQYPYRVEGNGGGDRCCGQANAGPRQRGGH